MIRICKNSFYDNLEKIENAFRKIMPYVSYTSLILSIFLMSNYFESNYFILSVPFLLIGVFGSMYDLMLSENGSLFEKLNNKLKLFGWNEDC